MRDIQMIATSAQVNASALNSAQLPLAIDAAPVRNDYSTVMAAGKYIINDNMGIRAIISLYRINDYAKNCDVGATDHTGSVKR